MLKEITEILTTFSKEFIDTENNWYNWREINEEKLPQGIRLPSGNQYKKNISLKIKLYEKWRASESIDEKLEMAKYYIEVWGGIRANSLDSMKEYTLPASDLIIKKGKQGIASWSKAIVIQNPYQYAIYDARVSVSLNCLQQRDNTNKKILFPVLTSRNNVVLFGNEMIVNKSKKDNWEILPENVFYLMYLELLRTVSVELGSDISTIEMLLFAKAEFLVKKAFELQYLEKFGDKEPDLK